VPGSIKLEEENMTMQGTWSKDEEGFMDFETAQLQRLYETITDQYYRVYNRYVEELDDEEAAHYQALEDGYEMITDYKDIAGQTQFATTFKTPAYELDIWYQTDAFTGKKVYDKGFMRISGK
jgi:hypothetical protein